MTIWDECEAIKPLIYRLLSEFPECRDSDHILIAMVWEKDLFMHDNTELMSLLKKGLLTNAETIRRTRQLLQEKNKELRGDLYEERQKLGGEMRKKISDGQLTLF